MINRTELLQQSKKKTSRNEGRKGRREGGREVKRKEGGVGGCDGWVSGLVEEREKEEER